MSSAEHNAYIGLDIGTSGCRAIAIDSLGNIIAQQSHCYSKSAAPLKSTNTSEQDPFALWLNVKELLSQTITLCQNRHIKAIAVDATSGSVLVTDSTGKPLSPILLYNDSRAVEASQVISTIAPRESAAHGTTSGLSKLLFLQKKLVLTGENQLLHQADWINFKLGAPLGISDENNALKSGYDPVTQQWPNWINQVTNPELLPKVVAAGSLMGQLSNDLCQEFGLTSSANLIAGTTDSIAALIATGANSMGDAVTSLGSTLVVKLITNQPLFLPEQGIYSHRLGKQWLVGGASNSGGAVLKHYFNDEQLAKLSQQIDLAKPTFDYYPLLSVGERFPINDPLLQPRLTPRPDDDVHFLHSLLQSIATIELQAYDCLHAAGTSALKSVRTVGGGAKNPIWQTIRQQTLAIPFITPPQTEAAYGSAQIARGILDQY